MSRLSLSQIEPFLSTREFFWVEGYTAFDTKAEADAEIHQIVDLYRQILENRRTRHQWCQVQEGNVYGGLYTTTIEDYIPTTARGIQAAISHSHLSQLGTGLCQDVWHLL